VARRILVGIALTLLLLAAARRLSMRKPVDMVSEGAGLRVFHRTVTEQVGPAQPRLVVQVEPAESLAVVVRWISPPSDEVEERSMVRTAPDVYECSVPDLGKGARMRYWITATNVGGAEVRLPKDAGESLLIKFKGTASSVVLAAHVAFMFGAFFFMVMSLFGAIRIIRGLEDKKSTVRSARWVLILSFLGGWPLGFLLNYQTFGVLWEGYPFGYDITDNKTQVLFIFWLVSLLLAWGSFTGTGEGKDRLGRRAFAAAILVSFLVSLALFILPHSI
jgi:hypothetical protein